MDQAIRNKLRNVVTQCRKLLEEAVAQVLQGQFGIYASGKKDEVHVEDVSRMGHLGTEDSVCRSDLLDHFEHIKSLGYKPTDALAQLIREIAFTHLNRLCAYKMMEAREVWVGAQKFREAVSRGLKSQGFLFYLAHRPEDEKLHNTGHQDIAYRHFLDWLGGTLSEEIGVLFSPTDPANRLYPSQRVLEDVIDLLNGSDIKPEDTDLRQQWPNIWSQDEIIGWVYQYFTPNELRDQVRKESAAPRNSYELAFRNQFFTPRYVVEFLTDNTLGRIWYEMRTGDTKLKEQCRYMVRRPNEVFLSHGKEPPKETVNESELSQEEILKQPVFIPHRPKKDPRELKILDPACGSGHFLLYCFDLLETIYEEAYNDPELGEALKKDYPTVESLRKDMPRLILAHNLHGIDIDMRATQIAALSLWLRCQRAYKGMGVTNDRPKINRSNMICAEPMPGEKEMLKEFTAELQPRILGQLVEVVFDKMTQAGEAGSLLKIEREIQGALKQAKQQWAAASIVEQRTLFDLREPRPSQRHFDLSGLTDMDFFEQAEARVIDTLQAYAQHATSDKHLQRRLFTDDALRGFAFMDVCRRKFDIILMNPPFGLWPDKLFEWAQAEYKGGYNDIYAAFLLRTSSLLVANGFVGAISSNSFLRGKQLEEIRRSCLIGSLSLVCDLGLNVMDDAWVESAAYTLTLSPGSQIAFIDLREENDKADPLCSTISCLRLGTHVHIHERNLFYSLPRAAILYDVSVEHLEYVGTTESVDPMACTARKGLTTFDNERFVRIWWECDPRSLGRGRTWILFSKGGEFELFYQPLTLAVKWGKDGQELMEKNREVNGQVAQARQGSSLYFRAGMTFPTRSELGFCARLHPRDCIYSSNGPVIIPNEGIDLYSLLGFFNSSIVRYLLDTQSHRRSYSPGMIRRISWQEEVLNLTSVREAAFNAVQAKFAYYSTDETYPEFTLPPAFSLSLPPSSFTELAQCAAKLELSTKNAIVKAVADIDDAVQSVYGSCPDVNTCGGKIGSMDRLNFAWRTQKADVCRQIISYILGVLVGRWDIREGEVRTRAASKDDLAPPLTMAMPGMLEGENRPTPVEYPIRVDWDGILVDDSDHGDDIVRRIRDILEFIWKDQAEAIEKEACEILGIKRLRDYFRKPGSGGFWADHISRYSKSRRKAPIYWLLQSSRRNYALWLYYHRLDKDILFKALVNYVEPKIRLEENRKESFRPQKETGSKPSKLLDKEIEKQEDLLSELRDFEDKLRRAATLHLEPDLNDGVILNIAPLWELVPWKDAKTYWEDLMQGEYDWSSIGKQLREKGLVK